MFSCELDAASTETTGIRGAEETYLSSFDAASHSFAVMCVVFLSLWRPCMFIRVRLKVAHVSRVCSHVCMRSFVLDRVGVCCAMGLCGVLPAGKVLITSAQELLNYSQSEEEMMEAYIKKIVACGAGAVIVSGTIGQLALHFLEKYKILVMKIMSKFEMRRLAKVCGARLIAQVGAITPEDMGAFSGHVFKSLFSGSFPRKF